jgi:hypothetical protein
MTDTSPRPTMRGGIIAAGHGTRLRADGYRVSKPMVPVAGRPLIDLTLDRFRAVGIRRLTIIINDASDDCLQWLRDHAGDFDLDLIVRATPSWTANSRRHREAETERLAAGADAGRLLAGFDAERLVTGADGGVGSSRSVRAGESTTRGRPMASRSSARRIW